MGRVKQGVNDLKAWCLANGEYGKTLMNEWVGELDTGEHIDMSNVARGSQKKVKWKCRYGHNWVASIESRTYIGARSICPYCSKLKQRTGLKTNSLYRWCLDNGDYGKQIAREWTGRIKADTVDHIADMHNVACGSNRIFQWECSSGHKWFSSIYNRTHKKTSCPYCRKLKSYVSDNRNSLTLRQWCLANGDDGNRILRDWTGELNTGEKIDIDLVTYGSGKKVKWVCSKCGYVWVKEIHSRTIYKSKCPFCKRVNRKK